jgi:mono/diheme cytochrome c family protein
MTARCWLQKKWNRWRGLPFIGIGVLVLTATGCGSGGDSGPSRGATAPSPAGLQAGEAKFNANCSACHGLRGVGTEQGPPLVHKIYLPNHHPDVAFRSAAANGVRAHHWNFGNMPKIETATPDDVESIITYVRWLQQQAGIN